MTSAMMHETTARNHLQILGLDDSATWSDVERAYRSLVSDLTPGSEADHRNVPLALSMLADVKRAYDSLRVRMVA